tara:strand:+ start:403 stop:1500 length:1098 start_codon:yes stop_codon:yes gene_type:complete
MKIAIVHDWLTVFSGAEKVLEQIIICYPDADIFTTIDTLKDNQRDFLKNKKVRVSKMQNLPFLKSLYRFYVLLFPNFIKEFDLSSYDLIISSSHAIAKGVKTSKNQLHICYIHTPARYVWDLRSQYLKEHDLDKGIKFFFVNRLLDRFKKWDLCSSKNVDYFIANSNYVKDRVKRIYNRESVVIYPPVDVKKYQINPIKKNFYLAASRLVSYKKIDIIIDAFLKLPNKKLVVIGDGPEYKKIRNKIADNISILGYQSSENLVHYMKNAKAFIFAADEDFGIMPVEAQACGTPIIAFNKGGATETVINNKTGIFFEEQTSKSIFNAVENFELTKFDPMDIRKNALQFSNKRFRQEFVDFINEVMTK